MEMEGAGGKQSIIRTSKDLDVWKVCRDLRIQIATMAHVSKGGAISVAGPAYQGATICYGRAEAEPRAEVNSKAPGKLLTPP